MRETEIQEHAALRGEKHPCCEIGLILQGEGTAYLEGTEARFQAGDLLLIGPGVPHSAQIDRFPHRELAVFFSPALLLEMGPLGDGAALLRRITMRQKIGQRLVRLPGEYRSRIEIAMGQMWMDFHARLFGWEMRLRACLTEMLVAVVQWEAGQSAAGPDNPAHEDWAKLEHALAYLRRHHAEPIYATDLARATGMSETRLKILFDQTLGMPWTKFLQGYRVRRAATLLCLPGNRVTDVALTAGFESLSHFTRVFRKFTGTAPSDYARNRNPRSNIEPAAAPRGGSTFAGTVVTADTRPLALCPAQIL
jgi:AraC-like DNA-binding protein